MADHSELIQRPIVTRGDKAVLARPVQRLSVLGIGFESDRCLEHHAELTSRNFLVLFVIGAGPSVWRVNSTKQSANMHIYFP